MRKDVVLITGANGEIGHGLISHLGERKNISIVAMDVQPLDETLRPYCERFIQVISWTACFWAGWWLNLRSAPSSTLPPSFNKSRVQP